MLQEKMLEILHNFCNYANITETNWVYKLVIFCGLLFSTVLIFYQLRKSRIISTTTKNMYEHMLFSSLEKKKSTKVNTKNSLFDRWEKKFEYSRIRAHIPFMTNELWIAMIVLFSIASYLLTSYMLNSVLKGIFAAGAVVIAFVFAENILAYKNFQKTDDMLIEFLNMLGNYSITSNELTSAFEKISYRVDEPLRSALMECYLEAQTNGNAILAIRNLSDKLEHPKLKEIIKNLEVAVKYSADFTVVVSNNRKSVEDYINAKQERQQLSISNLISLIISLVMFSVIITFVGMLLGIDAWAALFKTNVGQIVLAIAILCFVYFYWKIITINK